MFDPYTKDTNNKTKQQGKIQHEIPCYKVDTRQWLGTDTIEFHILP